jgi:glycosyltransferase involved in cell wall biosynthesis
MSGADEFHVESDEEDSTPSQWPTDLDGILRLHGVQFLESAYRSLLLRKPDAAGINCHLPRLMDGTPKIQILRELAASAESRDLDARLPGLKKAVLLYRLGITPVAGRIIKYLTRSEGNSIFDIRLRSVEETLEADFRNEEAANDTVDDDPQGLRALIADSGMFDAAWYREQSPALGKNVDLLDHFLRIGGFEGRSPSADFDAMLYLQWYQDVRKSGANPLVHYLLHGKKERRRYVATAAAALLGAASPVPVTMARIVCLKTPEFSGEAAVFVTHSPDGLIKPHVAHFISELKRGGIGVVLAIAADRPMQPIAPDLTSLLAGLFVRENKGYDFAAWAHVLQLCPELFGAPLLYFINDSNYGPLNGGKFASLLQRIRGSTADVIGLTDSYEHEWHVQSYFLAFKPVALSSIPFHRFLNSIGILGDKDAVIRTYELKLAPYLRDHGMKVEVIFDAPYVPSAEYRYNRTLFNWKQLIEEGYPFIKVVALRGDHADIDATGWREIVAQEGYDASLIEYMLAKAQGSAGREAAASGSIADELASYIGQRRPKVTRPLQVALIGPWNYDNGLGYASRGYISALWHTDFRVNVHAIRSPFHIHKQMAPMVDCQSYSGDADLAIVHVNPDGWGGLLTMEQRRIMSRARKVVGAWVWETQRIPDDWYPAFDSVDAIWAPSRYCADNYQKSAKVPVEVIPYFIAPRMPSADTVSLMAMRSDIGILPGQRVILYCFDGASYVVRKNPAALIAAFATAGLARDGWVLVLKTKNLFDSPAQGQKLQELAALSAGVILIDRSFDAAMMDLLMNVADIYASSHRSEGFGMTIAEAMALGKIAVATDYGGSRDFVDDSCGYPVPYALQVLTEDHGHYTKGTVWADVDTAALADALRKAAARIVGGDVSMGRAARDRVRLRYSAAAIGEAMQRAAASVLGIQ